MDEIIHHSHHGQNTENQLKQAFSGGIAAALTRCICQPFDVLKIRFQLQVEPLRSAAKTARTPLSPTPSSKYLSLRHAINLIMKEEGFIAFWKGHNPAQVLSIIYGVSQFWFYEQCKFEAKQLNFHQENENLSNFLCGALAGTFGTIVCNPLDVVRTRLIAQDNARGYPNTYRAFVQITKRDGVRGLYRGLLPSVMQVAPLTGINFMFYKFLCGTTVDLLKLKSKSEIPAWITLINGAVAGLAAKSFVYPLDLVKKRMQIQGFSEHRKNYGKHFECEGFIHCLRTTVQKEGFLGLYKGMAPSIWKAGLTSAFNFCIYDNLINLIMKSS